MNHTVFESEREIKTFVDLFHGSEVLLEKSKNTIEGSYYTTMSSLLLTAFTFEAYLNHLGEEKISFWQEIEKVSIFNKYKILCTEFSISINLGKRPYQTFKSLFKFRNSIAHGSSQIITDKKVVSLKSDILEHEPKTQVEEFCTVANAIQARKDIEVMIIELNSYAGLGEFPFSSAMTVSSLTLKNNI